MAETCGFIYEHASGFRECCTRNPEACEIVGHGNWKEYKVDNWTGQTYGLDWLNEQANAHHSLPYAMDFLREIGVVRGPWRRANALPRTSLDRQAIPAGYLAEVAYTWDRDGESSPTDFVSALEFEVDGTDKNDLVGEVLSSLGREARE